MQQQQYVDRLAATLGVDAASITLSIAPASIVVTASIRTVAPAAALATLSEMASNATKASEILNVVVEAVAALVVESNDAVVHSPPSMVSPPTAPSPPPPPVAPSPPPPAPSQLQQPSGPPPLVALDDGESGLSGSNLDSGTAVVLAIAGSLAALMGAISAVLYRANRKLRAQRNAMESPYSQPGAPPYSQPGALVSNVPAETATDEVPSHRRLPSPLNQFARTELAPLAQPNDAHGAHGARGSCQHGDREADVGRAGKDGCPCLRWGLLGGWVMECWRPRNVEDDDCLI